MIDLFKFYKLNKRRKLFGFYAIYSISKKKYRIGFTNDFYIESLKYYSLIGDFNVIAFKHIRRNELTKLSFKSSMAFLRKKFAQFIKIIDKNIENMAWININIEIIRKGFRIYHEKVNKKGFLAIFGKDNESNDKNVIYNKEYLTVNNKIENYKENNIIKHIEKVILFDW